MNKGKNICRICSGSNLKELRIGKTDLIKCDECKIIYNSFIPEQSKLDDYYTADYKITSTDHIQTEKRRIFRIPEQIQLISELIKYKSTPAKILDVGCDKGFFLDEARRYGFDGMGIEPSEKSRKYCNIIGIETVKSFSELSETFDIITMWHSLEHFSNPVETLTLLKKFLNNEGIIAIRVPAFDSIYRKILKDKWIWFQPENHYYHFTTKSLRNLMIKSGFQNVKIRHNKPNNRFTKKMNRLVNSFFKYTFDSKLTLRNRISRIYEDITAEELFVIAEK